MLYFLEFLNYILPIFGANFIIGLISFPVANRVFGKLPDKGYAVGHVLGWIVIAYVTFVLGFVRLGTVTVVLAAILWTLVNLLIYSKAKVKPDKVWIISTQLSILMLLVFITRLKGATPDIYKGERLMNFGILKALENSNKLPLYDFWMSGKDFNYYYFGHVIGFCMLKLSHNSVLTGQYGLIALVYALLSVNFYVFGYDFIKKLLPIINKKFQAASGILSAFLVLFAGTYYSAAWLIRTIFCAIAGCKLVEHPSVYSIGYIKGTLTENPVVTFLIADNHAHMWGMFSILLILLLIYTLWYARVTYKLCLFIGFVLGTAFMINTWNIIILLPLVGVFVVLKTQNLPKLFAQLPLILLCTFITALVWLNTYSPPLTGIGLVMETSLLRKWLIFWGFFVIVGGIFIAKTRKRLNEPVISFIYVIFITFALTAVFTETFYFRDATDITLWRRANTVFKLGYTTWILMGTVMGPILVYLFHTFKSKGIKAMLIALFIPQTIYIVLITTSLLISKYKGISHGIDWWSEKYPHDYAAYNYLKSTVSDIPVIIEATDFMAYNDSKFFSAYTGWKSVLGFFSHESTWRGRENQDVLTRAVDIEDFYTSPDQNTRKNIINKYGINYIVLGELETKIYGTKLRKDDILKLGTLYFSDDVTNIVKVK